MSEAPAAPTREARKKSRIWATLKALTRTRVMAGLIVVLPIYVTIVVVRFVFEIMRDSSQWVVYGVLEGNWVGLLPESWGVEWQGYSGAGLQGPRVQWGIAIFSVFLTVIILYTIGLLTTNIVGHRVLTLFERVVDRVPLVKTAYRLPKQILATFAKQEGEPSLQRVVLVPFPSNEVRSVGFLTGTCKDAFTGEELCSVFVATAPTTTGFVFILKRRDIIELDWSVEDAVKVVMSGGILMPQQMAFAKARQAEAPLPRPATHV